MTKRCCMDRPTNGGERDTLIAVVVHGAKTVPQIAELLSKRWGRPVDPKRVHDWIGYLEARRLIQKRASSNVRHHRLQYRATPAGYGFYLRFVDWVLPRRITRRIPSMLRARLTILAVRATRAAVPYHYCPQCPYLQLDSFRNAGSRHPRGPKCIN